MPHAQRNGLLAGMLLTFGLCGVPAAAESPSAAAVATPSTAVQRDLDALNRLLRQRQQQTAAPRPQAPATTGGAGAPAAATAPAPPAMSPELRPATPPAATMPAPGEEGIRSAVDRLADENPAQRASAQSAIRAAGQAAVPALIDALENPEERIRVAAVTILGDIADPRAAEPLTELLRNPSSEMWAALWDALRSLRKDVAPALIAALESNDQNVRWRAVTLMGSLRDVRYADPLIELLNKDRSTGVRVQVAWALGKIRDRSACEALLDALHDW